MFAEAYTRINAMSKMMTGKKVAKNMILSVTAQAVSLMIGFILNLIVPKFISEYDYSYWQTFLLYSQYLGIFHFGFLDGFVLRYSKDDYNELDKKSVRTQYLTVMLMDLFISVVLLILAFVVFSGVNRTICILLAFTTCIEITFSFMSFTFQTTNRIKEYVIYTIVYRVLYCVLILICLLVGFSNYYWFCVTYLLADLAVIVFFGLRYNKDLFIGPLLSHKKLKQELKTTLSAGVWLMISSYAANFLVGSGKMVIQWFWDELVFGKISLAFSLCNFVLQFVTAVSVVLFPSMKRMEEDKLPAMYVQIRNAISPLMFFALILYFPGSLILSWWLPKYTESIVYLGILMPIIIYTSKVSLLTNNYLKAYRKEKILLMINLSIVVVSFLLFLLLGYFVRNIQILLIAIVLAIMLRSIISEIVVMRIIKENIYWDFLLEFVLTVAFIIGAMFLNLWYACAVYAVAFIIYCIFKRKAIISLGKQMKSMKNNFFSH